jgi:hypothetical protein
MVENSLLKGFSQSPELCQAFFQNEAYADKMLESATNQIYMNITDTRPDPPKHVAGCEDVHVIPGHHSHSCSPQCYCLKFQDTPLSLKGDARQGNDALWEETFADITKRAAKNIVSNISLAHSQTMIGRR